MRYSAVRLFVNFTGLSEPHRVQHILLNHYNSDNTVSTNIADLSFLAFPSVLKHVLVYRVILTATTYEYAVVVLQSAGRKVLVNLPNVATAEEFHNKTTSTSLQTFSATEDYEYVAVFFSLR